MQEGFNSRLFCSCVLLPDLFHKPFIFLVAYTLASCRAPFNTGHYHIPRDGLSATLAIHIWLIRPYLILMVAKDADQLFRRWTRYLFTSRATFFHDFILPTLGRVCYEIDHIQKVYVTPCLRKKTTSKDRVALLQLV